MEMQALNSDDEGDRSYSIKKRKEGNTVLTIQTGHSSEKI
jgi:hypothetical protein